MDVFKTFSRITHPNRRALAAAQSHAHLGEIECIIKRNCFEKDFTAVFFPRGIPQFRVKAKKKKAKDAKYPKGKKKKKDKKKKAGKDRKGSKKKKKKKKKGGGDQDA